MIVVSVVNQKGGVGKTLTTVEVGVELNNKGKKVAIIDLDPQGNATSSFGIEKTEVKFTVADLLKKKAFKKGYENMDASDVVINKYGIDIYPNNIGMAKTIKELNNMAMNKENLLKEIIKLYLPKYDYILLDCPPTLGLIPDNALIASNYVIIPACADKWSMDGIADLLDNIEVIRDDVNPELEILGVVLTRVDTRTNAFKDSYSDLKEVFGEKMFTSYIRTAIKVNECLIEGVPVGIKAPEINPSEDYRNLVKEIIFRVEGV